jgi:SAM-dependent methyltransferase
MTAGDAEQFFDAIAGRYDRAYALPAAESRRRMDRVIRELPPAPARVLDLGVGTGRELASLLDAGLTPTGIDVSRAMLARCARRSRPVELVHGDFWHAPLPFHGTTFDGVVALHGTLAHPPAPDAIGLLARELARLVRPAGVFVAEVPSPAWLDRIEASPVNDDRRVRRTGPNTCAYEDLAASAAIEATVLDDAQWAAALGPMWEARVEGLGEFEWLVVARRS